ncbi:unnamed protein product [Paramecium primaurelia]|uniref:Uncharacterized protein n=1 Tax=Paramecium primaurelia TaxID=5886 RepID=A0A8S1JQQ8_PARPR|nr:unnamed protein product [Paramecium primaurelia]
MKLKKYLDPKQPVKSSDFKTMPKYFQVGTYVDGMDYYNIKKKKKIKVIELTNFQNMIKRNKLQKIHFRRFNKDNKESVKQIQNQENQKEQQNLQEEKINDDQLMFCGYPIFMQLNNQYFLIQKSIRELLSLRLLFNKKLVFVMK